MSNANTVASDAVTVVIIVMILLTMFMLWLVFMYWLMGRVKKLRHSLKHGAPDYKYLRRMEAALSAHNLTEAMEKDRERA